MRIILMHGAQYHGSAPPEPRRRPCRQPALRPRRRSRPPEPAGLQPQHPGHRERLGIRLFDRDIRGVRPTPAGEFVIERARKLLFEARCLQRDVDLYRDSQLGDTAFGVGPLLTATLMPRALAALRRQHPQVALRMEVGNWVQLLESLRTENIEFFAAMCATCPGMPRWTSS